MGRSRQAVRSCCRNLEERWWVPPWVVVAMEGYMLFLLPGILRFLEVFWRKRCQGLWLDWPWDWGALSHRWIVMLFSEI